MFLNQLDVFPLNCLTRLRQNYELLKHRLAVAKSQVIEFQRELSNKTEENHKTDKRMNSIKPGIMQLQRRRQQYVM